MDRERVTNTPEETIRLVVSFARQLHRPRSRRLSRRSYGRLTCKRFPEDLVFHWNDSRLSVYYLLPVVDQLFNPRRCFLCPLPKSWASWHFSEWSSSAAWLARPKVSPEGLTCSGRRFRTGLSHAWNPRDCECRGT